jgi:hypothetical protein
MLEYEAGMSDVELTYFVIAETRIEDVTFSHLEDVGFIVGGRLAHGFGDLFGASLDTEHRHSGRSRHHPRVLSEAGPEVDDALAGDETRGFDAALVKPSVQRSEPLLFGFTRSMRIMG